MSRQSLKVVHSTIPGFEDPVSGADALQLTAKMKEWDSSDYAGYRRILNGGDCAPDLAKIRRLADAHRNGATGKTVRDFVILGIGGSSLGGEAIVRALRSSHQEPRFHVMDNSDPDWLHWLLESVNPEETLFYVVMKSGGTAETISQFLVAIDWAKKKLAGDTSKSTSFAAPTLRKAISAPS